MPIHPFGSEKTKIIKSPKLGNDTVFSNGKSEVEIIAWDVKNTMYRRQYSAYSKVYNDETVLVLRTHNPVALELETDDTVVWQDYAYSVQEVHQVDVPINVHSKNYEISLK